MDRLKHYTNIPMEILRSVVAVTDTGSFSKAATLLGLTQPAISAQLKKLEILVGGNIFKKTPNGSAVTELGQIVVLHARKILESNDHLLHLRGDPYENKSLRLGISSLFADSIFDQKFDLTGITVTADNSTSLLTGLLNGYIDVVIALITVETKVDLAVRQLAEREIPMVWVRSKDFVLGPGSPIPLLTWPGQIGDQIMTRALEEASMIYRVALSSPDHHTTVAAARAGVGFMALPVEKTVDGLIEAKDCYLPPLPPVRLALFERTDMSTRYKAALVKELKAKFFKNTSDDEKPSQT